MERNRRTGGASVSGISISARCQRGRNPSDEEGKTGDISELSFRKRPKKDMYGVSAPATSLNKRKRWRMAQDNQPFGSLEEVKAEHDDEPSAPPQLQKHGKSRARFKEDKFLIDFSAVPRKQRSSITLSSRLTSTAKDQQDICSTQQQSPVTMVNRGSLNKKRRLKRSGTELLTMKKPQVSDFPVLSHQEAEVAEALFVLASSTPSHTGVMHSKLDTKLDTEAMVSATLQRLVVVPSSSGPDFASAGPKGKQLQNDIKKEDEKSPIVGVVYSASSPSELVHSSVGDTELDFILPRRYSLAEEATSFRSETLISKIPAGSPHCVPHWPHESKETPPRALEEQCKDSNAGKKVKQDTQTNPEMKESRPEEAIRMFTAMRRNNIDSSRNYDESIRSDGVYSNSESKIDLMALEGENSREHSSALLVKENSRKGLNSGRGYLKLKGRADGGTQGANQEAEDQNEKTTSETVRRMRDRDVKQEDHSSKLSPNRKVKDTGNSSVSSCFSSLSSTAVSRHASMGLAGWMNGVPHLGLDGSATSWAGTSSLSIDMKAAQPTMQLPYTATASPVPKMKSCATHVYVAHYIHCAQQATRRSFWSAGFCGATAYNLNMPPVKLSEHDRLKVPSSISASNLPTISRASSETSTVTASGHAMADQAQYLQTRMWPSGASSFPLLVNGHAGEAAQFFGGPFFQPHLIPHLQPLTQQAAMIPPVQKQQQAKCASSSAMEQQKILQSTCQLQQQPQNLKETSASESSAHPETQSKDLSLMAPSGGVHVDKFQEVSTSLSPGQQQHLSSQGTLSSPGHKVKGLDRSSTSTPAMIVGPGHLGLVSAASMATIEGHGVQLGSAKRDQNQRTGSREATSAHGNAFILKVQGNEDRRVTMKQQGASFEPPEAVVEPSLWPLCGSSASSNDPLVNDGLILWSVRNSGTQSCESASALVHDQGPFFFASQQASSLLKAEPQSSSTPGTPSTPPRVHSLASAASQNALETVTGWSSPPSVSKGVRNSALESLSGGALPLHPLRDEAQHDQQAGLAQQCLDSDAQTLYTQQEQPQGVSTPSLAAKMDCIQAPWTQLQQQLS